jgi:AcrR family transcriptional regulator
MSPRGRAIPDIRERLFRAGEHVLMTGGPAAVSARSVAREAGVAAGALYNHFDDLDDFLAELVVDRFRVQAERAAALPRLAGTHSVAGNLAAAVLALLESPTLAVAELVRARPGLPARVMATLDAGAPGMAEIEAALVAYLDRERELGRVAADADVQAAVLMLTGAAHHLMLMHGPGLSDAGDASRRIAHTIVHGIGGAAHD